MIMHKPIEWKISDKAMDYADCLSTMEGRVADITAGKKAEYVWLLEHPPVLTAGTSAKSEDLVAPDRFPVHHVGRGGQYTYHGPGQRVIYVMLDLKKRNIDIRHFIWSLEQWVINALTDFNVMGERRQGRVGIWVDRGNGREDKIAAIGVRVRKWVTFHGIAINVEPDLRHFETIVPCGIKTPNYGVTSLVDLGLPVTMGDLDLALLRHSPKIFTSSSSTTPQ